MRSVSGLSYDVLFQVVVNVHLNEYDNATDIKPDVKQRQFPIANDYSSKSRNNWMEGIE